MRILQNSIHMMCLVRLDTFSSSKFIFTIFRLLVSNLFFFTDRVGDFSDEDEEFSSNEDGVEEAEGSDSEPMLEDNVGRRALQRQRQRQAARAGAIPANARVCYSKAFTLIHCMVVVSDVCNTFSQFQQRNLKQKFIALLKRFRVSEDLQGLDHDQEELSMSHKLTGDKHETLPPHFLHSFDCVCVACVSNDINCYGVLSTPPSSPQLPHLKCFRT